MMCKCGHGQMEHEPDCLYCDCEQYEPAPAPQEPAQEPAVTWNCRFHPTDWWHEVGCPHVEWTKEQLQEALESQKKAQPATVKLWFDARQQLAAAEEQHQADLRALEISRNQTKDAFERVAQEHNGRLAAEERARQHKDYLDAVAQVLHPHKPEDGWTYLPDQLAGMVTELRERARQYKEDTERLDWLEKRRCALNAHYGTHYGWKFVSSRNVNRLFVRDVNTIDLNDAEARAGNIREAIDAARKESQL